MYDVCVCVMVGGWGGEVRTDMKAARTRGERRALER
jgi:hypothetical protein